MCENQAPGQPQSPFINSVNDPMEPSSPNTSELPSEPNSASAATQSALLDDFRSFKGGSVLDRVPKGSRSRAASALCVIIKSVVESNLTQDWRKLFRFISFCLKKPKRGGKRQSSLATTINRQIDAFMADPLSDFDHIITKTRTKIKTQNFLAKLVGKKLACNDVKGAIRILSSDSTILPFDEDTLSLLSLKHPLPHSETNMPPPPDSDEKATAFQLSEQQVFNAIQSFPGGSAGGRDLLLPQHLKDLTSKSCGEPGARLLGAVTLLCNKMLRGEVPAEVAPFLYGASLIAFSKPGGGVRPIAIGSTLRRVAAKATAFSFRPAAKAKLFPRQLGVAVPGGAEAAVHAARSFCTSNSSSPDPILFLKIDFENAFNSIRRDKMLRAVRSELGSIYPFVFDCYFNPSNLFFNNSFLLSAEGVQQGDPLGPLCFSLAINSLISNLSSEFNVWYLDDGTLAGSPETVLSDFETIVAAQESLGLKVNMSKCEISALGPNAEKNEAILSSFRSHFPETKTIDPADLSLLGSPLFPEAIDPYLQARLDTFKSTCSRLETLDSHDALFLLKNVFNIPKLLYLLRTSLCYSNSTLTEFDNCLRTCLANITNCHLDNDAFEQASLPVKLGGLGVRGAVDISLPAFIASSYKAADTVISLLPQHHLSAFNDLLSGAVTQWKAKAPNLLEPALSARASQKSWDLPLAKIKLNLLLEGARSPLDRSRIQAVSAPGAGAWLNAVPIPSLGLKLDNESLRISVALRLGSKLNTPYACICGAAVEDSATHGLDCRRASGKHARHSAVNDIIHRALSAAGVPSHLEPAGMCRDDGKRPDGATLIPWKQGRCLVWDFTCPNTIARSHISQSASLAGSVCASAEANKKKKYSSLSASYIFVPIAVETLGPWGPEADSFVSELGHRLSAKTGDHRSGAFLRQKISVAIQRGNATCILGSFPRDARAAEDFFL